MEKNENGTMVHVDHLVVKLVSAASCSSCVGFFLEAHVLPLSKISENGGEALPEEFTYSGFL